MNNKSENVLLDNKYNRRLSVNLTKKNKIRYFSSHNIKKTKIIDFINQHINSCTYLGNHNDILIKKFL